MVNVNGIEFPVYELDTIETLKERIALYFNTLPKYLFFSPELKLDSGKVKVTDILDIIKKNKETTDFNILYKQLPSPLPDNLDIKSDILGVWLSYNTEIPNIKKFNSKRFELIVDELIKAGYFTSLIDYENYMKHNNIGIVLKNNISTNQIIVKNKEKIFKTLEDTKSNIEHTNIHINRVKIDIPLITRDLSILELFNYIELVEAVPFATTHKYYKILKDFIPEEDWLNPNDDNLFIKISPKENINTSKKDEYIDINIFNSDNVLHAKAKLNIISGNLNRDKFIHRLLNTFKTPEPIEVKHIDETEVVGVFFLPNQTINSYVFSDLVMNDPLFSQLFSIDESDKATKKKSEKSEPYTYVHFEHGSIGHVTISLIQKYSEQGDTELKNQDMKLFPINSPYIRVRMKGQDMKLLEKFIRVFLKLIMNYKQKYQDIVDIYRQFIPDFAKTKKRTVKKHKNTTQKLAKEVFVAKYTRTCPEKRVPKIISKEEAEAKGIDNKSVSIFPRDRVEGKDNYPSDGVKQHYYYCGNPDYPFFGLQKNKLENSRDYPFVPCCFVDDRSNKTLMRKYYQRESGQYKKEKKQQELIKTDKILGHDKYGTLPENINNIFKLIDPQEKISYVRLGVYRNRSSFLNAVMTGMYKITNIFDHLNEKSRDEYLKQTRIKLSDESIAPLCKQSLYDKTMANIIRDISDPNVYFNPSHYVQLLSEYFNCNIFLFNRNQMFLPRFMQGYYSDKKLNKPCIFVYEHWGSESDHASYPQCELIVRWFKETTKNQYYFSYNDKISQGIRKIYRMLRKSYVLNRINTESLFSLKSKFISQQIDTYGKCRSLTVSYSGKNLTIYLSPIAPRKVKEDNKSIHRVDIETAQAFANDENINIIFQGGDDNTVADLTGIKINVMVTILIKDSEPIPNLPIRDSLITIKKRRSRLDIYNKNKKLARYITEYAFWLFSHYLNKKKILAITDKVISNFAKEKLIIKKGYRYGHIQKKFLMKSGVIENEKLIVTSRDMLKRILYVVKLYSIRNTRSLVDYHNRNVIQHYYQDITDFDQSPSQVILYGEDSIEKWIDESKTCYIMRNDILIGSRRPYFFSNKLVENGRIFLAQNIDNLEKAMGISLTWNQKNYNPSIFTKEHDIIQFILYSYINQNNITKYLVKGDDNGRKIRILGYKIDDIPLFTVLMDFEQE